ncbi:MAG: LamG-like jellyroll fold domain-containing protein, partial [Nitrospirota bacterium]
MGRRERMVRIVGAVLAMGVTLLTSLPVQAQTVLFGPQQYTRTAGPPNQSTDTFTLPTGTTAPYTLHIVNGNANGTNRISSARVTLNGTEIAGPTDFGQNVVVVDRTVILQATNTLQVRLTSAPGSFLTISMLDTGAGAQPTALTPSPLHLPAGATGTLTATLAPAPTAAGALAVSSANAAVATAPASVSFAAGQTSVSIPVTAVGSGSTTVTVSLNGGTAASQVDVALPLPTISGITPTSGQPGTPVTVTGTNFVNVQTVAFNGVTATFTVTDATTVVAVVPSGGTTGPLAVQTLAGTAISATPFTVIPAPTLATLQPATLAIVQGETGTLTVTLHAVQSTETTVSLSTSNAAVATVPSTVTVPATQLNASITVTAIAPGQADITAFLNGTSAGSAVTVVHPVPSLTTLSPTSLPSGSPATTLTLTGQRFVAGATVQFGVTTLAATLVSATQLSAVIPAAALTSQGTVPVTVTNPAPGGGVSNSLSVTIVNGPPQLSPIGNQTVPLGSTLTFTPTATDPDNDPVTVAVTPLPLPEHATFNSQTGEFVFTPAATQVGNFLLTIIASDGILTVSETITVTVTGAQPGGITGVSGRVVDGSGQPIASMPVSVKGTSATTTTNAQGQFTLTNLTVSGRQVLLADGFPLGYAILAAPVDLIPSVMNTLASELRVPALDMASAVTVNPNATTVLGNPAFPAVSVTIPPHTAKNPDGTDYTGVLTISPVPEYGRPESRPVELKPGFSITIQPAGITMATPVPITLPNIDNLSPGNELDLWSLYPDTGTFLVVGRMRVSADGQRLETIDGGVRKTAWHFALAPNPQPNSNTNQQAGPCTQCGMASQGDLTEGALTETLTIPSIRSLGVSRDLTLRYTSTMADVQPILPVNAFLDVRAAVPPTFSARLNLGGVQQGKDVFWDSHVLPENANSTSRLGVQVDAAHLSTGVYPFELTLFSNYPQSSIGGANTSRTIVRNEQQNPIGAGWTLSVVDRLYPQSNGALLLAKGDGNSQVYGQVGRPIVINSFSPARSLTVFGRNTSFVAGDTHAQARADLLTSSNFGPSGTVPRSVTLRAGVDTITLEGLAGTDVFIMNHPVPDLTPSEVAVLEQFVAEGGSLFEMRDVVSTRPLLLGTLPGVFLGDITIDMTPEGMTSPLGQGPFGTVGPVLTMAGNSAYATTNGAVKVARNDAGPNVLLFQPTGPSARGRAVLVGDDEIFASGFSNAASNQYNNLNNRPFFLNTIAFLAGAPGFRMPPPPPNSVSTYQGLPSEFSTIVQNTDGTYTRTMKDGSRYQFNAQGLQASARDRNGNQTTYAYDGSGRLTTTTDPVGLVTTFAYSGSRLATITDPQGRITQFTHDGGGNLTGVTYADTSTMTFAYDPQHRLLKKTDARNQVTQYVYDYTGRLSQATLPDGATRTLTSSQRLAVPNLAAGQGTAATPSALSTSTNNQASFTDAKNQTTRFETDVLGRVIKQTDALNRVTTIQRDAQGNPTQITRPNGAVTAMTYDAQGNLLTSTEQAIAATTTFIYEPTLNQVTRITDPQGNQTNITYDATGNPLTITDADNKVTQFFYNAQGLLTETRDVLYPANPATTFTYDALGRLLTTTDPLNRTTTFTYDAAGHVATSTDALNRVTSFQYDVKNRLTQVTDPNAGITAYAYDGNGNLLTVQDAKHQVTTFAYDSRNRLLSTTDPLGKTETYEYDGNDNLIKRQTPKGDDILFAYDAVNQLLSKTLPGSQVTSYLYDQVGNLTHVTDPDSVLAMIYDQANRLTTVKTDGSPNQPAVTLSYTSDKNGNRVNVTDPVQSVAYRYDGLNRLTQLGVPGSASCPTLPTGLVSRWLADGTAADAVGSNAGTLRNGTTFGPGLFNQAFHFDGIDDFMEVPDAASLTPSALSLSFWLKLDTLTSTSVSEQGLQWVFFKKNSRPTTTLFNDYGFAKVFREGRHHVVVGINAASGQPVFVNSTTSVVAGLWYHVLATVDAQELKLYIDGVLEGTSPVGFPLDHSTSPLIYGATNQSLYDGKLAGSLDDIQLFNRVLSPAEVPQTMCQDSGPLGHATTYTYDALSRRTSLTLPNGIQTTYTYDPASQVTSILHQLTATSSQINKADYVYNPVGNRTSLTDRRGPQAFGYDQLDRLT